MFYPEKERNEMENRPIRVAQIIGRVAEGGVERMVMNLFENIDHSKFVFDFFVENTSIIIDEKKINAYGGRVIFIPSYKRIIQFKRVLKDSFLKNHYDIVHANMNALNFLPLKVAKKCHIKIRISHSHSSSHKKERIRHLIKLIFRKFSKRYATNYLACSKLAGNWLFGKDTDFQVINNGINIQEFTFDKEKRATIRKMLNISPHDKVIGHVGRFCSQKNQKFLVDIYREISLMSSKVHLLMVGSGQDLPKIQKYVEKHHLLNVHFVGPVSNVSDYYSVMDCFVLPSLYEGLPVVGVEAQANGLKCFFSNDVTSESKLLPETEFMSLKEGPKHWAINIQKYLDLNKERVLSNIPNNFDIQSSSNKLFNYYKNVLKKQ